MNNLLLKLAQVKEQFKINIQKQQQLKSNINNIQPLNFQNLNNGYVTSATNLNLTQGTILDNIDKAFEFYKGTPYVYGGDSKNGIDCSAFVKGALKHCQISVPRTSIEQWNYFKNDRLPMTKPELNNLQKGDLLFFNTLNNGNPVSHVGIYLGNGEFCHASSGSKKVTKSKLTNYYEKKFVGACRPKEFQGVANNIIKNNNIQQQNVQLQNNVVNNISQVANANVTNANLINPNLNDSIKATLGLAQNSKVKNNEKINVL